MMEKTLLIRYDEAETIANLDTNDAALMQAAIDAARGAYAPYSHFHVGAAVRLTNGTVIVGNNQENVAYPSGLCAERTALFAASAQHPDARDVEAIAIVGINQQGVLCEASPCGACRQVLSEYENNQQHPLRTLCYLEGGRVRIYHSVADLLPFSFTF